MTGTDLKFSIQNFAELSFLLPLPSRKRGVAVCYAKNKLAAYSIKAGVTAVKYQF
jgi:hypothetical protein